MHRLEHGGPFLSGVEIRRRCDADGPGHRRPQIGKDVAEEVGAHHNVEPVRMQHEVGGEDVDMELRRPDVRVAPLRGCEPFVPVGHRVHDAIGLGGRRDVPGGAGRGKLKGPIENSIHTASSENALLHRHLVVGTRVEPSPDLRVLAFDILPHHDEVDLVWPAIAQRRLHPVEDPHRAHVDILVESAADGDEQPP